MAQGRKTGGRQKGVPNKATSEVVTLIDGLCGPNAEKCFGQLAAIGLQPVGTPGLNLKAWLAANQTLIAYRHGKPKEQVDLGGVGGGPVLVRFVDA